MKKISKCISAAAVFLAFAPNAITGSAYDGSWNLVFLTQRGACDPTYDFVVHISNGIITHPNLLKSNIGKLLLATKIYDMHRVAHYVSGGLIVALPGPEEDHNPETKASIAAVMGGRPDIPAEQRAEVARFIEDLTVSREAGWLCVPRT
jgi:hypothetical protein